MKHQVLRIATNDTGPDACGAPAVATGPHGQPSAVSTVAAAAAAAEGLGDASVGCPGGGGTGAVDAQLSHCAEQPQRTFRWQRCQRCLARPASRWVRIGSTSQQCACHEVVPTPAGVIQERHLISPGEALHRSEKLGVGCAVVAAWVKALLLLRMIMLAACWERSAPGDPLHPLRMIHTDLLEQVFGACAWQRESVIQLESTEDSHPVQPQRAAFFDASHHGRDLHCGRRAAHGCPRTDGVRRFPLLAMAGSVAGHHPAAKTTTREQNAKRGSRGARAGTECRQGAHTAVHVQLYSCMARPHGGGGV